MTLHPRANADFINKNIERLNQGERPYLNGIASLRDSGELAVRSSSITCAIQARSQYHAQVRRALRDLGKYAVNPLCTATEMSDTATLAVVCTTLGDLGYDAAVPFLARVVANPKLPPVTRGAATDAIQRITGSAARRSTSPSRSISSRTALLRRQRDFGRSAQSSGYMWYWTDEKGLTKLDVPRRFSTSSCRCAAADTRSISVARRAMP